MRGQRPESRASYALDRERGDEGEQRVQCSLQHRAVTSAPASALWHIVSERVRPGPLGAARIGLGLAALLAALESAPRLLQMFDPGRLRVPAIKALGAGTVPLELAWITIAAWVLSGSAFLLGWQTRAAGTLLTLVIGSVLALDLQLYSNHLYLLGLLVALMTLADAGAAHSLDSRRRDGPSVPRWPVVLVKAQVSIVYGFAALSKLNEAFLSGGILSGVVGEGLVPVPESFIRFETMFPLALVTVTTEGFLSFGLWLRWTRRLAVWCGIAFHVAIALLLAPTLEFLVFGLTLVPTYLLFAEGADRRADIGSRAGHPSSSSTSE